MKLKTFYWNEETIDHFKSASAYITREELLQRITEFVENDCEIEEDESEQDLIDDLERQVYAKR